MCVNSDMLQRENQKSILRFSSGGRKMSPSKNLCFTHSVSDSEMFRRMLMFFERRKYVAPSDEALPTCDRAKSNKICIPSQLLK